MLLVLVLLLAFLLPSTEAVQPIIISPTGVLNSQDIVPSEYTIDEASWKPLRCVPLQIPTGSQFVTFDRVGLHVTDVTSATESNEIKMAIYNSTSNDPATAVPAYKQNSEVTFETLPSPLPPSGNAAVVANLPESVVCDEGTICFLCAKWKNFGGLVIAASNVGVSLRRSAFQVGAVFTDPLPELYFSDIGNGIDVPLLFALGESQKTVTPEATPTVTRPPTLTATGTTTGKITSTSTTSMSNTPTETLSGTPTALPTGRPTLTPELGAYQYEGIAAPPELKQSAWIDFQPKEVIHSAAFTIRLTGVLLTGRTVSVKVARGSAFADCEGYTVGGEATKTNSNGEASFNGVSQPGSYTLCYKTRKDWELVGHITFLASTNPAKPLEGHTSCAGLISSTTHCGCYWGDAGDAITLPTTFSNDIIQNSLSSWTVNQGCCGNSQVSRTAFTSTPVNGYCSTVGVP